MIGLDPYIIRCSFADFSTASNCSAIALTSTPVKEPVQTVILRKKTRSISFIGVFS